MPLTNPMDMLRDARAKGYCVGAFNVVDYLTIEAVTEAAERTKSPAIIQTSSGTVKRFGLEKIVNMTRDVAGDSKTPICLHLDHGIKPEIVKQAVEAGYNSVMIDGSEHPFEENIAVTKDIVESARSKGVAVEGEIGVVAGVEDDIVVSQDQAIYTTPEEAMEFQRRTGVDFLAAAIGTAHGVYKTEPKLDIDTLRELRGSLEIPLVVHGGTGLSPEVVRELVQAGAAKFNVSTQIKVTYIDALYGYIDGKREEYNILKVLANAKDELTNMIAGYMEFLGSAGKA